MSVAPCWPGSNLPTRSSAKHDEEYGTAERIIAAYRPKKILHAAVPFPI